MILAQYVHIYSATDKFNIAIESTLQSNAGSAKIMYTTVHNFRQVNMLQKIGIRDFRDNLAKYLSSSVPVAILRHGQTVGYFVPTQLQPAQSEQESLKRAAAALDALLLEHGIDEDTLLAEFRQLRSPQL
jgi:hypothetical protein